MSRTPFKKEVIVRKQYTYSRGSVRLDFTLRYDYPDEIMDFIECVMQAHRDLSEDMSKFTGQDLVARTTRIFSPENTKNTEK